MERPKEANRRKVGRPLSFDRDAALEQAMLLFWRHGYETTSISDLRTAMGVNSPSIYAAFGDKKRLFLEAIRCYLSRSKLSSTVIEDAKTAREAAMGLLRMAATGFTGADTPPGCLLATSAISCSAGATDVQRKLAGIRRHTEVRLRTRIESGVAAGELPAQTDAAALAGFILAVIQGMSTLARDGASRNKLLSVAQTAMQSWPTKYDSHSRTERSRQARRT